VTIPGSVISIGSYAFYNCINLTSVMIYCNPAITPGANCFSGVLGCTLYMPSGAAASYSSTVPWNNATIFDSPHVDLE